jgi:hypothetical protein
LLERDVIIDAGYDLVSPIVYDLPVPVIVRVLLATRLAETIAVPPSPAPAPLFKDLCHALTFHADGKAIVRAGMTITARRVGCGRPHQHRDGAEGNIDRLAVAVNVVIADLNRVRGPRT